MSVASYTPFMVELHARIIANDCTETTANMYLNTLRRFNGGNSFRNLAYLRQTHFVDAMIEGSAPNTQKTLYSVFISVMRAAGISEKPTYKKAFNHYVERQADVRKVIEEATADGAMTAKEEEAWIAWSQVVDIHKRHEASVAPTLDYRILTTTQYNELMAFTILSLYVLTPPRRIKDYHYMYVVPLWDESMPETNNYYCWTSKRFIFGAYKTAGTYGQQIVAVPEPLQKILADFVRHHPILKGKVNETTEMTYLFNNYDGTFNDTTNFITRILNRIFHPHKISAGALRHIYLNHKLDLKGMTDDSTAMAHSLSTQRSYLRTNAPASGSAEAGTNPAGADDGTAAGGAGAS